MCGLLGVLHAAHRSTFDWIERGLEAIHHRGPDDFGIWADEVTGIALAHRRLSIVDLSPAGHQPMVCNNGRYVIAFNGEI